jgi:hypothetical protein
VKDLLFENLNIAKILSFLNVYKVALWIRNHFMLLERFNEIQSEESELYTNDAKSKAVV